MTKRIIALLLALVSVVMLSTGCTKRINKSSKNESENEDNEKTHNYEWVTPKPIENVTLEVFQVSIPEGSTIPGHKVEYTLPEVLDTSYDAAAFYNYSVKYSLTEHRMLEAAIEKKLDTIYKGIDPQYNFLQSGETIFQESDNRWGVIKNIKVSCMSETYGVFKEEFQVVVFGLENDESK